MMESTPETRSQRRPFAIDPCDIWFRATMGLRKTGGRWLIVHDHSSVPFYMDGSYRAAMDLQP